MTLDLSEDLGMIEAIDEAARSCREVLFEGSETVYEKIRVKAERKINAQLQDEAKKAMQGHREFSYEPLQQHLMENLRDVRHVRVDSSLGSAQVFDKEVGGTWADFQAGRYPGMGKTPFERSLAWKYGIYVPAREGGKGLERVRGGEMAYQVLADYGEVIEERLANWGDKAPYWYFLEHGNLGRFGGGGGFPWPTFGPTGFIMNTEGVVALLIQHAAEEVTQDALQQVEYVVVETARTGKRGPIVMNIVILDAGWRRYTFQSTRTRVYYQWRSPQHRWQTYEQMMDELG